MLRVMCFMTMIGIFDSGLGGLTILKELKKKLPKYDYLYLGDNARAPYGSKSQDTIYAYTREAIDFLFSRGCGLIIMACNTASARALRRIQQEYLPSEYPNKKVLGVLIPAAEIVGEYFQSLKKKPKRVGIIGTRATIESRTYEKEIKKLDPEIEIFAQAAPLLVPLIEEGWMKKRETKMILKKYLRPLKEKKIQALILGCTHYPILEKQIQSLIGKNIKIINTPAAVADKLKEYLQRHPEIKEKLSKNEKIKYYTTGDIERFKNLGQKFLGRSIKEAEKAEL